MSAIIIAAIASVVAAFVTDDLWAVRSMVVLATAVTFRCLYIVGETFDASLKLIASVNELIAAYRRSGAHVVADAMQNELDRSRP